MGKGEGKELGKVCESDEVARWERWEVSEVARLKRWKYSEVAS